MRGHFPASQGLANSLPITVESLVSVGKYTGIWHTKELLFCAEEVVTYHPPLDDIFSLVTPYTKPALFRNFFKFAFLGRQGKSNSTVLWKTQTETEGYLNLDAWAWCSHAGNRNSVPPAWNCVKWVAFQAKKPCWLVCKTQLAGLLFSVQ